MKHNENYWKRQLAHCDEVLALCEKPASREAVAAAEALLQCPARSSQAELELRAA